MNESKVVLLVDDDPALLGLMVEALPTKGLTIQSCGTSAAAEEKIRHGPFSALIVDALPGYEHLIKSFRRGNPHSPILVLTGGISTLQESRARNFGANLVLYKPVGVAALRKNLMDMIMAAVATMESIEVQTDADLKTVLEIEREILELSLTGDAVRLAALIGDEYVFSSGSQPTETKAQRLEALASRRLRYKEVHLKRISGSRYHDVCIVSSQLELMGTREGKDISGPYHSVRIYARKGKKWKAVAGQFTRQQAA